MQLQQHAYVFICVYLPLCQTRTHVNKLRATCVLKYEQHTCDMLREVTRENKDMERPLLLTSFDGGRLVLQRHVALPALSWCCFLAHMHFLLPAVRCWSPAALTFAALEKAQISISRPNGSGIGHMCQTSSGIINSSKRQPRCAAKLAESQLGVCVCVANGLCGKLAWHSTPHMKMLELRLFLLLLCMQICIYVDHMMPEPEHFVKLPSATASHACHICLFVCINT